MRVRTTLALLGTAVAVSGVFAPAAQAGDTAVTFTVAGGVLTLTAPASATLSAGPIELTGATATGSLGSTLVEDKRGTALHSVTVTMSSTNFTEAGGTTPIDASNVTGYSGPATTAGAAVAVPTLTGQPLAGSGSTVLTMNSVVGAGSASYSPTVTVAVPVGTEAGSYSGTVTQTAV